MFSHDRRPSAWHCCLLALTVLVHGTVLTGCAGMRLQRQARFQPPALNQSADPSWDAVLALPMGAPIHVELRDRDLIRGGFRSADQQALVVVEGGGQTRNVPRAEIRRVLLVRGNYAKQGALLGLGSGVGTLAILCGSTDCDFSALGGLVFGALFGGIGAIAGALVGAGTPQREVIYEAPDSGAANGP